MTALCLIECDHVFHVFVEAMLTGESVPQTKESVVSIPNIAKTADTLRLNLTNNTLSKERVSDETSSTAEELDCRRHVVYGGTIVVQHSEVLQSELEINEAGQAKIAGSYNIPPPPPDHGMWLYIPVRSVCLCNMNALYVLLLCLFIVRMYCCGSTYWIRHFTGLIVLLYIAHKAVVMCFI